MTVTATTPSAAGITGARRASRRARFALLLIPAGAVLGVFFFYPLLTLVVKSFTQPTAGLSNYTSLLHNGSSPQVLVRTLYTSLIVAGSGLIVGYPYAYAMTRVSARARNALTLLVLLPFWTGLMARNFAWYLLEGRGGLIENILSFFGIHGVVLLGTVAGVTVAMVQVMLPYMVLPLYTSMRSIDLRLMDAAQSMGASKVTAFRTTYLPLSMPGALSGFSLVFILALGFYITPTLLGSPQQALVSQVIGTQVTQLLDFPGAGAFGTVLLIITLAVLFVVSKIARPTSALTEFADNA